MRRLAVIALTLLTLGCGARVHRRVMPATARDWVSTLTAAQSAALEGRYRDADELLAGFLSAHPGAPEAGEVPYWRALFKLDPANHGASLGESARELDRYLASAGSAPHRSEALVLRRVAGALDSLRRAASEPTSTVVITPLVPEPRQGSRVRQQALEREVQLLQEQLDKANAELDRIKKRLAEPGTPPGGTRRSAGPNRPGTTRSRA